MSAPVKTKARSIAKADIEYSIENNRKWPYTQNIIDIIRCSICFDSIEDLIDGITKFQDVVDQLSKKDSDSEHNDSDSDEPSDDDESDDSESDDSEFDDSESDDSESDGDININTSDKIRSHTNDGKLKDLQEMSCCIKQILRVKNGFLNFGDCKSWENNNLDEFNYRHFHTF